MPVLQTTISSHMKKKQDRSRVLNMLPGMPISAAKEINKNILPVKLIFRPKYKICGKAYLLKIKLKTKASLENYWQGTN
jgi:hypothetical protein